MKSMAAAIAALLVLLAAGLCLAQCGSGTFNSPYGVCIHAPQGADLGVLLDEVDAIGIGWIRIDFVWSWVETNQDVFNWSVYDALVAAANARDIQVFATISNTPAWATAGSQGIGVPTNSADYYDICYRAAQRYDGAHGKGTVLYWGMWNEANLDQFWEGTEQQYIDVILKNGADGIHAGNPNAKVCGPELAHLTSGDADWYSWLRHCIEQAGTKLDVCTHHCYDSDGYQDIRAKLESTTMFGGNPGMWDVVAPSVKEVLQYTGWYGRPFWLTEVGWQSGQVGEAAQAANYTGILNDWCTGQPGRDWLKKVMFYEMNDTTAYPQYSFGIVVVDANHAISYRKQARTAYADFVATHPVTPTPPCKATAPDPTSGATNIQSSADLSWTAGAGAASHRIHFGTSNPTPFVREQAGTTYDPGTMAPQTTYYWRIDEVGPGGTAPGDTWTFTTLPAFSNRIYPNDDCFTYSSEPSVAHDNAGIAAKSQTENKRFGWLEFDLGSVAVAGAVVWMYQFSDWGYSYSTRLRGAEYSFSEGALTYNNQPDASAWTNLGGWSAATGAQQYYSRDITSFYNSNLSKRMTLRLEITTSGVNYGGIYEDREGSKGTTNYPYIQLTPDTTPPTTPTVIDDGAFTTSTSQIHANWSATDGVSGLAEYQYAISSTKTDAGIIAGGGWTSAGMSGGATRTGLSLYHGQVCYVLVKARDAAGNWSAVGCSDGIIVVPPAMSVGAARAVPDTAVVGLASKVVTTVFDGCFYVEDADRLSGIRIVPLEMPVGPAIGSVVDAAGTLQTTDGARCVSGATSTVL